MTHEPPDDAPAPPTGETDSPDAPGEPGSPDASARTRARRIARRIARLARTPVAFALWVVLVTLVLIPLLFRGSAAVGPGTFEAHVGPALRGNTLVDVPPIGSIQAPTHRAPVQLGFELREVDVLDALDPDSRPGVAGIEAEVRDDLPGAVRSLGLQLAGVTAL
ncbi:MAG: hypothetical protein ACYC2O_12920, partial [Microthrixaceae bacterium]